MQRIVYIQTHPNRSVPIHLIKPGYHFQIPSLEEPGKKIQKICNVSLCTVDQLGSLTINAIEKQNRDVKMTWHIIRLDFDAFALEGTSYLNSGGRRGIDSTFILEQYSYITE